MTHPADMNAKDFLALLKTVDPTTAAVLSRIRAGEPMAASDPGKPAAAKEEPTDDKAKDEGKGKKSAGTASKRSPSANKIHRKKPNADAEPTAGTAADAEPAAGSEEPSFTVIVPDSDRDLDREEALANKWRDANRDVTHDVNGDIPMEAICALPDAFLSRLPMAPLDPNKASLARQVLSFTVPRNQERGRWDKARQSAIFYIYGVKVTWSTRPKKEPAYVGKGPMNRVYPALMTAQNCNVHDPTPRGEGWRGSAVDAPGYSLAYGGLDLLAEDGRTEHIAVQRAAGAMKREESRRGRAESRRGRDRSRGRGSSGLRNVRGRGRGGYSFSPSKRRDSSKSRWIPKGAGPAASSSGAGPAASSSQAGRAASTTRSDRAGSLPPPPPPPPGPQMAIKKARGSVGDITPQILLTGPQGRSTIPDVILPPGWTACSFSPHPIVNDPSVAPTADQDADEVTHLRWVSGESEAVPASPALPPPISEGSYEWWCAPRRGGFGQPAGFPARREEHSLEWYDWTYKNQPPKAMDHPTDVHSLTIGIFACGKNHVLGFGPRAPQAHVPHGRFKNDYVLTDNFMFRPLASMMGDARQSGPPTKVPPERAHAVWVIDCTGFPHVGQGDHIGKHPDILRLVYDSPAFGDIRKRLVRFVDYVRYQGRSSLTNDNMFLHSYLYVRF